MDLLGNRLKKTIEELAKEIEEQLKSDGNLFIYIKGTPDPDAISSAYFLKEAALFYGNKLRIFSEKDISLPQNRLLVSLLDIEIESSEEIEVSDYRGYILTDHQSSYINEISANLPCVIHIDHHEIVEQTHEIRYKLLTDKVNSVSTICTMLLNYYSKTNEELFEKLSAFKVTTSLYYGIVTDTDHLEIGNNNDRKAVRFLKKYYDETLIDDIEKIKFTPEMTAVLNRAVYSRILEEGWSVSGTGFLKEEYRDSLALIADIMVRRKRVSTAVVFGIVERKNGGAYLDACVRTRNRKFELDSFIKKMTLNGGGRRHKGAFQVDLDYFYDYSDKEKLWGFIYETTINKLIRVKEENRELLNENVLDKIIDAVKKVF